MREKPLAQSHQDAMSQKDKEMGQGEATGERPPDDYGTAAVGGKFIATYQLIVGILRAVGLLE